MRVLRACLFVVLASSAAFAGDPLLPNGGFEEGLDGWRSAWARTGEIRARLDPEVYHGGRQAVRIEHRGSEDWSFHHEKTFEVTPGQVFEIRGWARVQGEGTTTLGVVLRDRQGEALSWTFGGCTTGAGDGWQRLQSRFLIPDNAARIDPRWIGVGPATVWVDDTSLEQVGSIDQWRARDLPVTLDLANDAVAVEFRTADAAFTITDRRTGRTWSQQGDSRLPVLQAARDDGQITFQILEPASMLNVNGTLQLAGNEAEVVLELQADGALPGELAYPGTFATAAGQLLILPVNEGISYPVDDETLPEMHYYMYGGHGLCMGWWGVTDGQAGLMGLVETPDDAAVRIPRRSGLLGIRQCWQPQRGAFGDPRRIRLVCFDRGGYVAMCKRYREHAREAGNLVTLEEKRAKNPHVDRLIGAVNVWNWDHEPVSMCREMQALGIDRILWSNRSDPPALAAMNELGVLTSRYDIYQDAMNPDNFPRLGHRHPDWTSDAWPQDLMIDRNGDWVRGWQVKARDGEMLPCGVLCDRQAVEYARRRIPPELQTHPYRGRFIDTTTASPWRECYHPDHPMTRSDSRHWKMQLLRYISHDCGLVTGSETGHEASVPYLHFFEGMMSLGPYRVPDAGRRMVELWDDVPERVAKFQTGHFYRLPLWELVYHDCTVSYWYWGDYNNKLPSLWDRRDLFNALYGTPPMFLFRTEFWQENRERFVESYRTAATVARATGYSEMLDHRWLSDDHAVQQTRFANGVVVTVNFGDAAYTMADGTRLEPLSHRIQGPVTPPLPAETPVRFVPHRIGHVRSEALGVGDLTGDGRLDIVAGPFLYEAPDWTPRKIRELPGTVDEQGKGYYGDFANLPLDVDGDGRQDVVSVDWFQKCIDWYRNPGPANELWARTVVDVSTNYECADLVDIDGDGRAAEILAHVKPTVWFERGRDAEGRMALVKHVVSDKEWDFGGGVGDLNRDGRVDILRPGAWYEAPADPRTGTWTEHPLPVGGREPGSVEHTPQILVLDVNADGLNDVITSSAHRYGIFWYEQSGDGDAPVWQPHVIDDSWSQSHSLTLADIDQDGTLDLVTGKRFYAHNGNDPGAEEPLGVYWYQLKSGPQPVWTRHAISYDEGIGAGLSIPVVDLDGDGDLDVVVTGKWGGPAWFENRLRD